MIMQVRQPGGSEVIDPIGASALSVPSPEVRRPIDPDYPGEDSLRLLRSRDDRSLWLSAGALLVGLALGWAGCWSWYASSAVSPDAAARTVTSSLQAENKATGRIDAPRRPPPSGAANSTAKPSLAGTTTRVDPETSKPASASHPNANSAGLQVAARPVAPAPETRPATIDGWVVLEVRGSTAVIEGPSGIRTVTLGETVPGIGRIDSIVRWGNRWIVATANGLIATP